MVRSHHGPPIESAVQVFDFLLLRSSACRRVAMRLPFAWGPVAVGVGRLAYGASRERAHASCSRASGHHPTRDSQHEPMDHPGCVARIAFALEAEVAGQLAHAFVFVGIDGKHGADAASARDVDEVAHQYGTQPLALPCVGHGDRALARLAVGREAVTADTDPALDAVFPRQRDERHVAPVIEFRQLADQRIAGFADLAEETHPARFRAQVADELALESGIFLAQHPDRHLAAVQQRHDRFRYVGRGRQRRDIRVRVEVGGAGAAIGNRVPGYRHGWDLAFAFGSSMDRRGDPVVTRINSGDGSTEQGDRRSRPRPWRGQRSDGDPSSLAVARAITLSSSVGITNTWTRAASLLMRDASPALRASSSTMPSQRRRSPMRLRVPQACSPMPPVNTSASRPSSATHWAAIAAAARSANISSASRARGSSLASSTRTSSLMPDTPNKPERLPRISATSCALMPRCCCRYSSTPGSIAPQRVPIIRPSSGVNPMDVETLRRSRSAHTLAPWPRCATTVFAYGCGAEIPGRTSATYSYERPWKPMRTMPDSLNVRGSANHCDSFGWVRWNAVSKHATCGTSGNSSCKFLISATSAGWCAGASTARASSSANTSASIRTGLSKRVPPCTTRCPTAARRTPGCRSRSSASSQRTASPMSAAAGGSETVACPRDVNEARVSRPMSGTLPPRNGSSAPASNNASLMLEEPMLSDRMAAFMTARARPGSRTAVPARRTPPSRAPYPHGWSTRSERARPTRCLPMRRRPDRSSAWPACCRSSGPAPPGCRRSRRPAIRCP